MPLHTIQGGDKADISRSVFGVRGWNGT